MYICIYISEKKQKQKQNFKKYVETILKSKDYISDLEALESYFFFFAMYTTLAFILRQSLLERMRYLFLASSQAVLPGAIFDSM